MIRNVVTRGFGNGTFAADSPATRGFGVGEEVVVFTSQLCLVGSFDDVIALSGSIDSVALVGSFDDGIALEGEWEEC